MTGKGSDIVGSTFIPPQDICCSDSSTEWKKMLGLIFTLRVFGQLVKTHHGLTALRRCPAPGLGAAQHGCKQHLFPEQGVFKDESRRSWEGWFYGIDGESVATWKMLITPHYLAPRPWHSLSDCPLSHGRSGIASSLLPSSPGRDGPGCAPSCPAGLGPRPGKVLKDRGRGHAQPSTSCHRRSRRTWPFPIRELSGEAAPGTGRVVHPFGRPGN